MVDHSRMNRSMEKEEMESWDTSEMITNAQEEMGIVD
jgi:hypothetical protein